METKEGKGREGIMESKPFKDEGKGMKGMEGEEEEKEEKITKVVIQVKM